MNWAALFPTQPLANSAKTTVLHSLMWMTLLLLAGLISGTAVGSPQWLLIVFAVLLVVCFLVFCGSFIYFARKDPELLRTENFVIRKLEIEHRLIGDSDAGVIEGEIVDEPARVGTTKRIGSGRPQKSKASSS